MILFDITIPANVKAVFLMLAKIISFDFIEADQLSFIIGLDGPTKQEAFAPQFSEASFESTNALWNLGLSGLILVLLPFITIIAYTLIRILEKLKRGAKITLLLRKTFIFSFPIRIFLELSLDLYICLFINIQHLRFENNIEFVSSYFSLIAVIILTPLPIIIHVFLTKYHSYLRSKKITILWGSFYKEYYIEDKANISSPMIFLLRRLIFSIIACYLTDFPSVQVFMFFVVQTFYYVYFFYNLPYSNR